MHLRPAAWLALLPLTALAALPARRGAGDGAETARPPAADEGPESADEPETGGEGADELAGAGPGTAPYRLLDNVEGEHVDLLFAPVRPMARAADGRLFAVDTHDSTVAVYGADLAPLATWRVAWGPVSLAVAPRPGDEGGAEELLVVCRGTQALLGLDARTGAPERFLPLPAEPADVLLSADGGTAFVSCSALDRVVEVDLAANAIVHTYEIPAKHPVHLSRAGADVLVAPMLSGNNTMIDPGHAVVDAGPGRVLDLADPAVSKQPLSDEDLFRIDPEARTVEPVATGLGTILFDHGTHPTTGVTWVLNTESHNVVAGEPALRGRFLSNRLSLVRLEPDADEPAAPERIVDLDFGIEREDGAAAAARPVAQPCALAFDARGHAFVAGLGSDNVTELDAEGGLVRQWGVGSIPRALRLEAGRLFVYCWGANEIEVYALGAGDRESASAAPERLAVLDLGHDPAPPAVQRGRRIYYDADNSLHGSVSCNGCHVDGLADMLGWDLSDLPRDDKGPLMTQGLRGLQGKQPFHWRGERAGLAEFNHAFGTLLGGRPLDAEPGGELDDLTAFLFGLVEPANPYENERRVVDDAVAVLPLTADGPPSSAVRGQELYFTNPTVTGLTCQDCHSLPAGTSGGVRNVEPAAIPRRSNFKTVSLLSSWRKEQRGDIRLHELADGRKVPLPPLGAGFSATGLMFNLRRTTGLQNRLLTPQGTVDVVSFLRQLDSGLAPAVHRGVLLDAASAGAARDRIDGYLLQQARARNCDVVAFGTSVLAEGAQPREARWFFDRASGLFRGESEALVPRPLSAFVAEAEAGVGRLLFLGLPVGMGRRFAVDFDGDDLFNADEERFGTDPLRADTDGDGFLDGNELVWGGDPLAADRAPADERPPTIRNARLTFVNLRTAKIQFDTDEPAVFEVRLVPDPETSEAPERVARSTRPAHDHSAFVLELEPDTRYAASITVTDPCGNARTLALPEPVVTKGWLSPEDVIVAELAPTVVAAEGGRVELEVAAALRFKDGRPAPQHTVTGTLYVDDVAVQERVKSPPSDASGTALVRVVQEGIEEGSRLTFAVDGVLLNEDLPSDWSLPDTAPAAREVSLTYAER